MSRHPKGEGPVGYKKPPKSGQFQKGQSGNPAGRPRGTRNFKAAFMAELDHEVIVKEGGKEVRLTKQELMIKTLMNDALKGNLKAMGKVFEFVSRFRTEDRLEEDRIRMKMGMKPLWFEPSRWMDYCSEQELIREMRKHDIALEKRVDKIIRQENALRDADEREEEDGSEALQ